MTTTVWDHLPNKKYIGQVLVDLDKHKDLFAHVHVPDDVFGQVLKQSWAHSQARAYEQAWTQAYNLSRAHVFKQALIQAYEQTRGQALIKARDHALVQAYYVATNALLALIAYDDANKYLTIPVAQAIVWGELVSDDQYILLKPYLLVKHGIVLLATA
jgi:hypothetical protein